MEKSKYLGAGIGKVAELESAVFGKMNSVISAAIKVERACFFIDKMMAEYFWVKKTHKNAQ